MTVHTNPNQQKAIEALSTSVVVSAGAGTGKTYVLVERFVEIVKRGLASPAEILAITFTEKAANEMKSRIVRKLQESGLFAARREIENACIGTIHAFCSRLLKEHPIEAGVDPAFRVIEENDAKLLQDIAIERVIESHFENPAVFDLLFRYSDETLREDVKTVYEKIRISGLSLDEAFQKKVPFDETKLRQEISSCLDELNRFDKKKGAALALNAFLQKPNQAEWGFVEALGEFRGQFDLRPKDGKEETKRLQKALDGLIRLQIEKIGSTKREAFQLFVREFHRFYESEKRERAGFDFNDLQILASSLMGGERETSRAIRERYRRQFKFVMVDEFQDTDRLESRLLDLIGGENNVFLVGDIKQSIYGFRGAEPAIFKAKIETFQTGRQSEVLALTENYRSRPEILEFVNHFFEELWQDGGESRLVPTTGAYLPLSEPAIEILEVSKDSDENVDALRTLEARTLAARIWELVQSGAYQYKDFALLFRATTKMHIYEQALRDAQIPYYLIGGRGFYAQPEIRDVLNFLTLLDNPFHDIPVAAVLRSPLFQVSDDTLFWLANRTTRQKPKRHLFEAIQSTESVAEIDSPEKKKLLTFRRIFERLFRNCDFRISETIEHLLNETRYGLYVLGLHQGKRHFANLRKLIDLARELESREVVHLGDFIRYVKGLQFQEVRESEAQIEAEEGEVVKLMTVHKAKGLEFKVVMLPDLLNPGDSPRDSFLFDPESGIGMKVPDEDGDLRDGFSFHAIRESQKKRDEEESNRRLYVAMTRARERLVLSSIERKKKKSAGGEGEEAHENWMERAVRISAKHGIAVKDLKTSIDGKKRRSHKLALAEKNRIREKLETLQLIDIKGVTDDINQLFEQIKPVPPVFFERIDLPVSAYLLFNRDSNHEEYRNVYELGKKSEFLAQEVKSEEFSIEDEEEFTAAEFGTFMHRIFEASVLTRHKGIKNLDYYTAQLDAETKLIVQSLLDKFLKSQLYANIKKAKRCFPELPFVLRLERGILQGTLDLLYETPDGEWVIVDYKTSDITSAEVAEKGESYRVQMELYALALWQISNIKVQKVSLYFTKLAATYDFKIPAADFDELLQKYENLQNEIIQFRSLAPHA